MDSARMARAFCAGALAVAGLASMLFAGTASAATVNKYAPASEARDFGTSIGGWEGSDDHDGLCVEVLLCPTVTNEHVGSDGADGTGDGFIQTELGSLTGVAANSTGTFRSPTFVYEGAGGKAPDHLKFRMSRRADVGAFLSVQGNSAEYSVALEKVKGDDVADAVEVIPATTMAGAKDWTSIDPVDVDPAVLDIGSTYRIVITSVFSNGAEVVPAPASAYDRVILRAMHRGGAGTVSEQQLAKIVRSALPKSVAVAGGKVKTQLKCQRQASGKCVFRNVKLVSQRIVQTKKRKAAVRSGKKKVIGLKLRSGHSLRTLDRQRTALLTGKLKVAGKTRKISRQVKVRVIH